MLKYTPLIFDVLTIDSLNKKPLVSIYLDKNNLFNNVLEPQQSINI